jgi:hypothetical protein
MLTITEVLAAQFKPSDVSFFVYLCVLLSSFFIGIYQKSVVPKSLGILVWLLGITIFVEVVGNYFQEENKWIYKIFLPVEYLLTAVYFTIILKSLRYKKLIFISIGIIGFLCFANFISGFSYKYMSTYCILLSYFLSSLWGTLYLIQCFREIEEDNYKVNPHFWICTGILFFYAGSFFQMGFTNIIYTYDQELAKKLYIINHLLNCVLYGMITYGFICQAKYRKLSL